MKRFWIMLVAVAMAIVAAIPAGAAKPDRPAKPAPAHFDVTFEFVDDNGGFSTEDEQCTTGGSITMAAGPGGRLGAPVDESTDHPLLDVRLYALNWYRYYPYYTHADDVPDDFDPDLYPLKHPPLMSNLTGCHGAGIEVLVSQADDETKNLISFQDISVEEFPRFLMLTVRDGSLGFRWEADYYVENLETAAKNPRKDPTPTVSMNDMEGFSYSDNNLAWAGVWDKTKPSSGLVTGKINVSYFSPGVSDEFGGSPVDVEFMMTITPTTELKLVKEVSGSDASPDLWDLTAMDDSQVEFTDKGGSGTFHHVDPDVGYALSESGPTEGYAASDWSCTTGGALVGSTVTLTAGTSVTCTITNTYAPTAEPSE